MDCLKLVVSACSPGSTDWKLHNRPHKSPCCLEITLLGLGTKLHVLPTYFHQNERSRTSSSMSFLLAGAIHFENRPPWEIALTCGKRP